MRNCLFCSLVLGGFISACSQPSTQPTQMVSQPTPNALDAIAPATETDTGNGYSDVWQRYDFWSGEYPNGLAVTDSDVEVWGLPEIARDTPGYLACTLPHKAVYSPWNIERAARDSVAFATYIYPTKIHINERVEISTFQGDSPTQLTLEAGDVMLYEHYMAEGYFKASFYGLDYELNENELPASTRFERGPDDEEWLRVTCVDDAAPQVWLRYDDLTAIEGIAAYNYTSYGDAADLP